MTVIRVSWLDQWQSYLDGEIVNYQTEEEMSVEDLIERLSGQRRPTEKMEIGTEFHAALESAITNGVNGDLLVGRAGTEFRFDDVDIDLPAAGAVPESERERHVAPDLVLRGHPDAIQGDTIFEWKTTWRSIDLEHWMAQWQWRAYLSLVPEANTAHYVIFRLRKARRNEEPGLYVAEVRQLKQHRYAGMEDEVDQTALALADFMAEHGVEGA